MRAKLSSYGLNYGKLFYVLFVIAAALFVWVFLNRQEVTDHKALVKSQYDGCLRGDNLRRQINAGDLVLYGVLGQVITSAEKRSKVDTGKTRALDLYNVRQYMKYQRAFKGVDVTNCRVVILHEKPSKSGTSSRRTDAFGEDTG